MVDFSFSHLIRTFISFGLMPFSTLSGHFPRVDLHTKVDFSLFFPGFDLFSASIKREVRGSGDAFGWL